MRSSLQSWLAGSHETISTAHIQMYSNQTKDSITCQGQLGNTLY